MKAPKMQVKCRVENCNYNKNQMCHANNLMINAMGDGVAHTTDGTSCVTFKDTE